jgi:hypothetical protein
VIKGGGYGVVVDIILGILGGVLGGWVFGLFGNLVGRRHDRLHHCGIRGRSNFGLDYPLTEKILRRASHSLPAEKRKPRDRVVGGIAIFSQFS